MIRRLIVALILFPVLALTGVQASDDGGTESVFNLGAGARAMAMGNGYVALSDDATAVYYNPAGMPYLPSQQVSLLHTVLFEGTVYDFISYVYPHTGVGAFGIAAMRIGTDDVGRRDYVTDLGRFSVTQMQLLLSYGRHFGERFSSGLSLKLAHQSLDAYSAYGYGLDLAGKCGITDRFTAGLMLQDIVGARLRLLNAKERTPLTIRGGVAYRYPIRQSPFSATMTLDAEKPEYRRVKIRSGLEVEHEAGLAVRGGFDRDNFTLGLGIRYQQLAFDYAYKFIDNLANSHRFSLSFRFGTTEQERQQRRVEVAEQDRAQFLRQDRESSMHRELKRADAFLEAGKLDSALAAYYRAEAFADEDTKRFIRGRIDGIKHLQAERRAPATPAEMSDADRLVGVLWQARDLVARENLKAARDIVDGAIRDGLESADLEALKREIDGRVDQIIRSNLSEARQAFRQGKYVEAYNRYTTVLAYDEDNPQAVEGAEAAQVQLTLAQHLKLAIDYFDQKRYILSQREFNAVLQLDPDNETAVEYLDRIEQRMSESPTQEEQDLRQDKEMWQVYLDGVEAYRAGDFERAIELWERVLDKYPNDKMTLENKRQAELRLRD